GRCAPQYDTTTSTAGRATFSTDWNRQQRSVAAILPCGPSAMRPQAATRPFDRSGSSGRKETFHMDIAIIAPPWVPVPAPAYGGTEAVLDELARGLQAAGHEVLLVCHPDSQCAVPKTSVIPAQDAVRMGRASIELENVIGA